MQGVTASFLWFIMGQINPWSWLRFSIKCLGSFVIFSFPLGLGASVLPETDYIYFLICCVKKEKIVLFNSVLNVAVIIESKEQVFPSILSSQEKESTAKFAEFSFQNKWFAFAVKED